IRDFPVTGVQTCALPISGGAISDIYKGPTTELTPTEIPPISLQTKNIDQLNEKAHPTADTKYSTAIHFSTVLRPYRSAGLAATTAPKIVPIREIDTVKPCKNGLKSHRSCMIFSAPEITAVSKPNRNPPKEAINT